MGISDAISQIQKIRVAEGLNGLFDATTVQQYTLAISGLNKQEAITLLQRQGLSTAQQAQVLSSAGLLQTTQMLNASLVEETLANTALSAEKQKELLISLGLADAKTKDLIATNECTVAEVAQALATKGIVGADSEAILSQLGLATANTTTTVSFAGLTTAIKANTAAMAKWLVTNPVGWCILAVGAIYGLSKAYDALTVSEEEMAEAHEESVQKAKDSVSEYEELKQELETIQQQYDDNAQKLEDLYKLRENQTITQTEKDYLEELEGQNEKLKQQLEYKQAIADVEAKEAEDDAVTALKEKTQDDLTTGHSNDGGATVEFDKITDAEKIKQNTATINALTADLTAYEKVIQGINLSQEEVDKYTQQLVGYQEQLNAVEGNSDSANKQREFYQGKIDEIQGLLNGTLTYEEYEKAVADTTTKVQGLVSENDTLLQKVEPLNDAIKSTTGENYELKKANDEIIANAKDAAIGFNEYTDSLNGTADALNNVQGSTSDNKTGLLFDTSEAIEKLKALEDSMEDLDTAYASLLEGKSPDLSSLDGIRESFAELENVDLSVVNEALDQIANAETIEQAQSAMNSLATEYLKASGIFKGLDDSNKDLIATELKLIGIQNADEVVTVELAKKKFAERLEIEKLVNAEYEAIDVAYDEVSALLAESDASGVTQMALFDLISAQTIFNNKNLDVTQKLKALEELAKGFGIVTDAANEASYATALEAKIQNLRETTNFSESQLETLKGQMGEHLLSQAQKKYEAEFEKLYGIYNYSYDYGGGSSSNKTKENLAKDAKKEFKETIDFIEERIENLDDSLSHLDASLKNVSGSFAKNKLISAQIDLNAQKINEYSSAIEMYSNKANEALTSIPEHLHDKVINGAIDIQTFVGEGNEAVVDAIEEYQKWSDKVNDCNQQLVELQKTIAQLELDKFKNISEDFENQFNVSDNTKSLIDKQIGLLEESGQIVGDSLYKEQIAQTERQLEILAAQKKALSEQMTESLASGRITNGSEEFLEMVDSLNEVDESILDCKTDIEKFNNSIKQLEVDKFERIADHFDNVTNVLDNTNGLIEKEIALLEESGQIISETFYVAQLKNEHQKLELLEQKKEALLRQMDDSISKGLIKEGSEEWISMMEDIYAVDESIVACKTDIEKLDNAILDLDWQAFERGQNQLSNLNSELENIFELFDDVDTTDENGNWTNEAIAQMGLLTQQYELALYQAQEYRDAIEELKADYIAGKYSATEYSDKLAELTEGQWNSVKASESAKDAILELYKARNDYAIEGIEKEKEAYRELIRAQIDSLDNEKDLRDYKKQISEKSDEAEKIERKIALLELDNSASANAEKAKLQEELLKIRGELEEMEYDHSIETQKEALNTELENFEAEKDAEIEKLEKNLDDQEQLIRESFETVKQNSDVVGQEIADIASKHGVIISDAITSPWENGKDAIESYIDALNDTLVNTLEGGYNVSGITSALDSITSAANSAKDALDKLNNIPSISPSTEKWSVVDSGNPNGKTMYFHTEQEAVRYAENQRDEADPNERHRSKFIISGNGKTYKYASGTRNAHGGLIIKDEKGFELQLNKLVNGRYSIASDGAQILTKPQTDNIFDWSKFNPSQFLANYTQPLYTPSKMPEIVRRNTSAPTLEFNGTLMHIDKVDSTNIKQMEKIADKAINKLVNKMYDRTIYKS